MIAASVGKRPAGLPADGRRAVMRWRRCLPFVPLIAAAVAFVAVDDCKDTHPDTACVNFVPIPNGAEQTCSGGGGGGGAGGGPTNTAVPTATATRSATSTPAPQQTPVPPFNFVPYTFGSRYCEDITQFVDPVNVIFSGAAIWTSVSTHALHHGDWWNHDGSEQWFQELARCYSMDQQSASGPAWQLPGRFHMRYKQASQPINGYGTVSIAAAHHEDVNATCGHVVDHDEDNEGRSGFDMAREDIIGNWGIGGSGHTPLSYIAFNNTIRMRQCDGRFSWSSDGIAVIVPIP